MFHTKRASKGKDYVEISLKENMSCDDLFQVTTYVNGKTKISHFHSKKEATSFFQTMFFCITGEAHG